jgi:hypothetical protein
VITDTLEAWRYACRPQPDMGVNSTHVVCLDRDCVTFSSKPTPKVWKLGVHTRAGGVHSSVMLHLERLGTCVYLFALCRQPECCKSGLREVAGCA